MSLNGIRLSIITCPNYITWGYTATRIWNREEKYQLCHIFEYDNKEAMNACLPVWQEIRKSWRGDFISKSIDYRGVQIDCQERQTD